MRHLIYVLAVIAGPAFAEDWVQLTGPEIEAALNDVTLDYGQNWQQFFKSGRTLYNNGRDNWGYWAVRGDQYCSQWPPADGWECYDMAREASSAQLRFISERGHITDGHIME